MDAPKLFTVIFDALIGGLIVLGCHSLVSRIRELRSIGADTRANATMRLSSSQFALIDMQACAERVLIDYGHVVYGKSGPPIGNRIWLKPIGKSGFRFSILPQHSYILQTKLHANGDVSIRIKQRVDWSMVYHGTEASAHGCMWFSPIAMLVGLLIFLPVCLSDLSGFTSLFMKVLREESHVTFQTW